MRNRYWVALGLCIAAIAAAAVNAPSSKLSAAAALPDVYVAGTFGLALSSPGFIQNTEGEGVRAEIVSERSPGLTTPDAFCNVAIRFLDADGAALYAKEVNLAPGQIESIELPPSLLANGGAFHVTFEVLDKGKNGKTRPCVAIPSVRVFDKDLGKTEYYLPLQIV